MNNKSKFINNNENSYFLFLIWKNKFYILAVALIFTVLFFSYQKFFLKKFDIQATNVVIKKPIGQIFNIYSEFFIKPFQNNPQTVDEIFFSNFKMQLNSTDNLQKFVSFYINKKKENNEFDLEIYKKLYSKIQIEQKEKNSNTYILLFPKQIDGPNLLNEYILFTYSITVDEFINDLQLALLFQLDKLNSEKNPNNAEMIVRINRILKNINKDNFKFVPILDKATSSRALVDQKIYIYIGFILGIFISIVFIFFRTAFPNYK